MKIYNVLLSILVLAIFAAGCAKEYSVETGGKKGAAGNWEFKDGVREYMGGIDTAYISGTGTSKQLHFLGKSLDGKEQWALRFHADTFKTGTYRANLSQVTMRYSKGNKNIYEVNQVTGNFTATIAAINGNLITGTFTGNARDSVNGSIKLYDGKFKATMASPVVAPQSVGVINSTSGNCDEVVLQGEYKQGISQTSSNTVEVKVIVATPGSYRIYTDPVNGVTFSSQGTFTTTGVHTVLLYGSGTPAFNGNQNFVVHYGNSQCAFKINFLQGVTASNDYYPLTAKSNWTYKNQTGGTMKNVVQDSKKTINGQSYSILLAHNPATATTGDTLGYFRKSGSDYFLYTDLGSSLFFDEPVRGEVIFLKDNLSAGSSWNTPTFSGKLAGVPVTFFIRYTILQKQVAEQVGTFNFTDILKVKQEIVINSSVVNTSETWYAKNAGPVKLMDITGEKSITAYQVF